MFRFLLLIIVVVASVITVAWYSSQTLPKWYQHDSVQQEKLVEDLAGEINSKGLGEFLGSKFAQVMDGQLVLSEVEFNALLLSSLQSSDEGRKILSVSDAVKAKISAGKLEVAAVIDLEKVASISDKNRKVVEQVIKAMPLLDRSKMFLSVSGLPIARNSEISFDESFTIKIGSMPIPSQLLEQLGVPVSKATDFSLPLKYVSVQSVSFTEDQLILGVLPKF